MASHPAREVRIPLEEGSLLGDLTQPHAAPAVVLVVEGSGLSRHGVQARQVAKALQDRGIGTLLADLLTPREQDSPALRHPRRPDLPLLTERALLAAEWLHGQPWLRALGLCGLDDGSPAALITGARLGARLHGMVCMGGRPEQTGPSVLATVRAPTLLLAGSRDAQSLSLNDAAYQHLRCERSLAVVPGGGPLLDEPGVLQHAAEMAADWFESHLMAMAETA